MNDAIPALTLQRPWAALILHGGKDVENRAWRTNHIGPLLIHAGKTWDETAIELWPFLAGAGLDFDDPDAQPTGIIGVITLVGMRFSSSPSPWAMPDQWHWLLADPHPFPEPIPCRGRQGLWYPPPDVRRRAADAMSAVTS